MPPHFSVREAINTGESAGNQVEATTDIPSHLWMRWTYVNPRIHSKPVLRRGMWLNDDVRFCFDVYQDVEQEEPEDTLTHTFLLSPCVSGRHFWYYLWGYIDGVLSPSTSIVMEYHPGIQCPPILVITLDALHDNRTVYHAWGDWAITHNSATGTIAPNHDAPTYSLIVATTLTLSYWIMRSFLRFDTSPIPPGSTISHALLVLYVEAVYKTAQSGNRHIIATQGVQDTPVIPANYGDQLPYTDNGGQVHLDDCTPGNVTVINLNDTGKSWIVPEGVTRLCVRQELDVINLPPIRGSNALVYGSAQADYWKRPKLTIQYEPP